MSRVLKAIESKQQSPNLPKALIATQILQKLVSTGSLEHFKSDVVVVNALPDMFHTKKSEWYKLTEVDYTNVYVDATGLVPMFSLLF